jgi:hypothetical protein
MGRIAAALELHDEFAGGGFRPPAREHSRAQPASRRRRPSGRRRARRAR